MILSFAVALSLVAVYTDFRWRIIKNNVTLPAIAIGLLLNLIGNGWHGLLIASTGLIVGAGLMMLPYIFGQMGGGDVKFMAALGSLLGGFPALNIFLYATIAGGVLGLIVVIARGQFVNVMKRVWWLAKCLIFRAPASGLAQFKGSIKIPYGLAIGTGLFCFLIAGNII